MGKNGLHNLYALPSLLICLLHKNPYFVRALHPSALQVPDGAPARVKEGEVPPADQDTKFSYLWNCRAWLDQATKVIIATGGAASTAAGSMVAGCSCCPCVAHRLECWHHPKHGMAAGQG